MITTGVALASFTPTTGVLQRRHATTSDYAGALGPGRPRFMEKSCKRQNPPSAECYSLAAQA